MARHRTDEIDRLRLNVWYHYVKHRSGLSDSDLNVTFAPAYARERSKALVDRQFERIRDRMCAPRRRQSPTGAPDLVERVDAKYSGTAAVMDSDLWPLLSMARPSLTAVAPYVDRLLDRFRLQRASQGLDFLLTADMLADLKGRASRYDFYRENLSAFLKATTVNLDLIALIVALYREAYLAGELRVALILEDVTRPACAAFCEQTWMAPLVDEFMLIVGERASTLVHPNELHSRKDGPWAEIVIRPLLASNDPRISSGRDLRSACQVAIVRVASRKPNATERLIAQMKARAAEREQP